MGRRSPRPAWPADDEPGRLFRRHPPRATCCVHHPYDSFASTVEEFVRQAADDPKVLAIKLTLYRTSGDSPIVQSLIRAAERASRSRRWSSSRPASTSRPTSSWARRLEKAGVHVVYGLSG